MRQALRALSTVLILAGSLLIIDAGLTLVWQEPVSAVYAKFKQKGLSHDLNNLDRRYVTQLQLRALENVRGERRRIQFLARALRRSVKPGDALARIKSKRMDINFVVVEGTMSADLRKGPGHYGDTPLPGLRGTVAIAGHRTTYLAPFRKLDKLRKGDDVVVEMPYATFTYRTYRTKIVPPSEYSVTKKVQFDQLVMTACHPLYSAAQRIVVFAKLIHVEPRGKAIIRNVA